MADHDGDSAHRRFSNPPQAIPLQDLSAPRHHGRLRALSDRGSAWVRSRGASISGGQYSPILERDQSPPRRPAGPHLTIPIPEDATSSQPPRERQGSVASPVDGAALQEAFSGLGFGVSFTPSSTYSPGHDDTLLSPRSARYTDQTPEPNDAEAYFSPVPLDTLPLTNTRHLQPGASTRGETSPSSGRPGRPRGQSVHFQRGGSTSSAMLGDDLAQAELGLSPTTTGRSSISVRRSLSPAAAGSTLQRAGTIVRNMSQRIVNLSNEQDVVDRTLRRRASTRGRLDAPPELPSLPIPGIDGPADAEERAKKRPSFHTIDIETRPLPRRPSGPMPNPLKGKSLGIFPPDSAIRVRLCDILTHSWTEPVIFVLIIAQVVLLSLESSQNSFDVPRTARWGTPIDFALLVIFAIFTAEIVSRIIVSGFIVNPVEYSTINRQVGVGAAVKQKLQTMFGASQSVPKAATSMPADLGPTPPSLLRAFTHNVDFEQLKGGPRYQRRVRLAQRAFLRHSFNRLDFIALVSYWISFFLAMFNVQNHYQIYVFRMLSCLRILKLLYISNGTTVILRSLKKAAPLLVNVAILIGFFWLVFAIIGVQSFKSSLRRQCTWFNQSDPTGQTNWNNTQQYCGGWLDENGKPHPWLLPDGVTPGAPAHKGYLCPQNSKCIQLMNPYNGTVSFDNILQSIQLVFVLMSSNTFSDLLYYLTQTDYLAAALYFAAGIVILYFWLVSLLIAVITSSFQIIREESKASAFTGEEEEDVLLDDDEIGAKRRKNPISRLYEASFWFWIAVIAYGLVVACLTSSTMGARRAAFISSSETVVTFVLLFEIAFRFVADWRGFFLSRRNIVDLVLAVITTVIQIPVIHNSGEPYLWLTLFQILRIYRVVLAIPITRDLIFTVVRNFSGLLNLIMFVFLLTFLASVLAAEMFRGTLPLYDGYSNQIRTTFQTLFNSFLGMYQILSSENWTDIMYHVTEYSVDFNTAWMGAAFFILWFILGYFIVLNMFIAVIQENFDVSEDQKRLHQVRAFLEQKDGGASGHGNLSLSTIFKFGLVSGRRKDPTAFGTATTELLLKDAVVKDFLDQQDDDQATEMQSPNEFAEERPMLQSAPTVVVGAGKLDTWWGSLFGRNSNREPNPFYARLEFSRAYEDLDPRHMAREVVSARERRKRAQREYLLKYPKYNVSLWLFRPNHMIRRKCQRIVGPGRGGDRIEGVAPSVPVWYAFSAFIYAAIVAMVILACVTTPLYQKDYFARHAFSVKNWFLFSDMGFAVLFTIEATIKVVADGFFFTPNAYFRSSWGFIDGIVLVTLWINISTALANEGQVSRAIGAFKALRALRLLNVSDSARNNFHAVIVRGGWKVISAAFVSLSLLIPFAIYGLNLFVGKMMSCNDTFTGISNLNDCVDEYPSSPYNWNVWAPRQVSNSYFSFDNFGNSLFILFQIVSQEGWVDVMWRAQSITGRFTQPLEFSSQGYAVFFVVFNLLGAVFVLTLFVSVFMRNYTEQTGVAFLTADQRAWLELRKLLRQISPSKRPLPNKLRSTWKEWCYKRAVRKTGGWQKLVTWALITHIILLCLEWYPNVPWWDKTRDVLFLLLSMVYIANIVIRIVGLTWPRFRRSSWDVFSIIAVSGTFVSTFLVLAQPANVVINRINKLYLVSIAFLVIPRNNQLDHLFKTAAASLPAILNLLATWFVLFLAYAIAMTQAFGLTRFSLVENSNINFRNVPKALILLFRMSIGEGWNQIMADFAAVRPPLCTPGSGFATDCGSTEWAYALFISWNILSMYIFANLFISLIYESFSYVYQRSSGLSVISREEIRRFKQAWAEFDPDGTGYITREAFPRLLGELSGVFEMRIYDGDFTVARLIEDCGRVRPTSGLPVDGQPELREIDLVKLNRRLAELPVREIRKRRARMYKFYEEVLVSSDPDRGIAFTSLLMILAHYKVINDNKSLRLHEFLRRRARLQRVDEAVRRNIVIGFFDTVYWSRRFRRHMEGKHAGVMTAVPQFRVPEIFVDDEAAQQHEPGADGRFDGPSSGPDMYGREDARTPPHRGDGHRPPELRRGLSSSSIQMTPTSSPTRARRLGSRDGSDAGSDHWRLAEAISRPVSPLGSEALGVEAADGGARSRAGSSVSVQDVLEALDESAWGESIRKSFSQRRPSTHANRRRRDG